MVSLFLTFLKTSALSILYFIVIPSIQPSTFPWLTVRLLAVASTPSTFPRKVWLFLASCGWPTTSAANSRNVITPVKNLAKARRAVMVFMKLLPEIDCDTALILYNRLVVKRPGMMYLRNPKILLALGILTRIVTFFYLGPNNNDPHLGMIQFLVEHKRLPLNTELMLGFHPPLYYLLAAPLYEMTMRPKVVQLLSLALSLGTLIVIYYIIYRTDFIAGARARLYSFWLACFLPQFVMFGLYVSNDTLTTFLGSLLVLQSCRYIQSGGWKSAMLLAVVTGLGLLTKATFLALLPIVLVLVLFRELRAGRSAPRAASMGIAFLAVTAGLGGYKFVDNYLRYRNPFMNSLDAPRNWSIEQQMSYRGLPSFLDVNISRLLASPHRSSAT